MNEPTPTRNIAPNREKSAERWISRGATLAIAGIILSAAVQSPIGGVLTLIGLAAGIIGLHRYGRSGARPLSSLAAKDSDGDVAS